MAKLEETYLCVESARRNYALPIENVVRILVRSTADASAEKIPVFSFEQAAGEMTVLLQYEGTEFLLCVEHVSDVAKIAFKNIHEVPPEILDETNRYLAGVAYRPERDCLLFVPDVQELLHCAQRGKGEKL